MICQEGVCRVRRRNSQGDRQILSVVIRKSQMGNSSSSTQRSQSPLSASSVMGPTTPGLTDCGAELVIDFCAFMEADVNLDSRFIKQRQFDVYKDEGVPRRCRFLSHPSTSPEDPTGWASFGFIGMLQARAPEVVVQGATLLSSHILFILHPISQHLR